MAESCKSETNTVSALLCTGNGYLWGFTLIRDGGAASVIFDDSTDGAGTEKYRAAIPDVANPLSHTVMFAKPIHFETGIYATLANAIVSAIWEGAAT